MAQNYICQKSTPHLYIIVKNIAIIECVFCDFVNIYFNICLIINTLIFFIRQLFQHRFI